MPLVNFANLDFDQIKVSIKDYLRANSKFTDYDFEGSNLSSIIDILAYNTYITSYNANMVSNEVFLDSATLRENVVSLIQNIGYLPRSRRAARLNASFYIDKTKVSNVNLERELLTKVGVDKKKTVVIRGDQNVQYKNVMQVIDIANRNKLKMILAVKGK